MVESILAAALRYAARGRRVVALRGKRPVTARGACDGTTDPGTIHRWFAGTDHNVGLCLDELLVVDIDPRNGGNESWQQLLGSHPKPKTLVQHTGADGLHYVFQRVGIPVVGKPAAGIDILTGPHRYIVAAPSIHPLSGRPYRWLGDHALATIPEWLRAVVARRVPPPMTASAMPTRSNAALFERARRYLSCCEPAISGQGGQRQAFCVALKLATQFPDLDDQDLLSLLTEWNARCQPPWSGHELQHKLAGALQTARR